MSFPPHLYGRRVHPVAQRARDEAIASENSGPYILTWGEGTQIKAHHTEQAALDHAYRLRVVYGAKDCALTGPDEIEYVTCGCGRVFRDGDGGRITSDWYVCRPCFDAHPAISEGRYRELLNDALRETK